LEAGHEPVGPFAELAEAVCLGIPVSVARGATNSLAGGESGAAGPFRRPSRAARLVGGVEGSGSHGHHGSLGGTGGRHSLVDPLDQITDQRRPGRLAEGPASGAFSLGFTHSIHLRHPTTNPCAFIDDDG